MKLSNLVIAMGLVTVALTACGDNKGADTADFTITVIDGYIVNGLVTAACGYEHQNSYTARTNESGIASLFTVGAPVTDCRAQITGDVDTYDHDAPNLPWLHTMASLPGLAVINPYTDVAAVVFENDPSLTVDEAMLRVFSILDIPIELGLSEANLFADYGANNSSSGLDALTLAKVAVLAESTFDAVVALKALLPADATSANLEVLYSVVLPQVTTAVNAKIQELGEEHLQTLVFSTEVSLPDEIVFRDNGDLDTDLTGLSIDVVASEKPVAPGEVPDGTGAGAVNQG